MTGKPNKVWRSYRFTPEAYELSGQLAEKFGTNRTAVFEQAVRKLAEIEGLVPKPRGPKKKSQKGA
jgi:hypothetical protein